MNLVKNGLLFPGDLTEKIIRSMREGLIVFNASNEIEIINEAAVKMLGFTDESAFAGKQIQQLFLSTEEANHFLVLLESIGHLNHQESIFRKADGQEIVGLYSAATIHDLTGVCVAKLIIVQDITARKKNEQQLEGYSRLLENSNQELDQFAYIVSHDLKAPLRAISNLSLWLQEDLESGLSEENRKNLMLLRSRVTRMESLISGILEYSKIGRSKIQSEPVDTASLLGEILELLVPPASITVEIGTRMPVLLAPKIMLFQVFSNLISNAIKYNDKPEGIIRIYATEAKDGYEFTIEDNGPGIAKEYYEKVFTIFQTLQSRDKLESTGIGLTIVKKIIDERGGKIWIDSAMGKGSKFVFWWPKETT